MGEASDAALVAAARAGDKRAFGALLVRHRPLLVVLCRRVLGDAETVEDVAQEVALQALLNLERLRRPERFGPWLAGIGLNLARRARRGGRAEWSWETIVGGRAGPEPVDGGPGPAEQAEAADLAGRVRRAVAALPPGQRAAVLLVYLEGLTQAEAAASLGVEVGAVKTRLFKARGTLRRTLLATWREAEMAATAAATVERETVEVRVVDVRRGAGKDGHPHLAAILEEVEGGRRLPIWMGEFEGTAIALHLERVEVPRPLTYAFAAKLLEAGGGRLEEVRVDRLESDVFYAVAVVDGPDGKRELDARPSDALNLALLVGAPIRVARMVLEQNAAAVANGQSGAVLPHGEGIEGAAQIAAAARAAWWQPPLAAGDPA